MGEAFVRILALHPDVEIVSRQDAPFGVLLTTHSRQCVLDDTEQAALWHACGASPRAGDLAPATPDLLEHVAQRVIGEGLGDVSERNPIPLGRDQHLQLVEGVEIKPAFYEVIDSREQTLRLLSELGVLLFDACDGRRTVPELHAIAQDRGFLFEVSDILKQVQQLQTAGLVTQGIAPRQNGHLRVRVKAVLVRAPADLGYLVSADEAEMIARFRSSRPVQDILATQPSQQDRQWVLSLINKATAVGLLAHAEANAADDIENEFDQDNPTEITYAPIDELGDFQIPGRGGPPARPTPPKAPALQPMARPTPAPQPLRTGTQPMAPISPAAPARATPLPGQMMPPARSAQMQVPTRSSQMPAQMQVPTRSSQMQVPMRSSQMQVPNPLAMHDVHEEMAPPMRASSQMLAAGTPMGIAATEPSGPVRRPSLSPADATAQARLASLSSLSLDKGKDGTPSTSERRSGGGSAKLPWILLVLVVAGGGYYIYTQKQAAPVQQVVATGSDGSSAPSKPTAAPGSVVLTASAYIEAKKPLVLSANASGRVKEILVDAGDPVKEGQLVARVDDGAILARLKAAQIRAAAAKKTLVGVQRLYRIQAKTAVDIANAENDVSVANSDILVIKQELADTKITSPINGTVIERLIQPGESISAGAGPSSGVLRLADLTQLIAAADIAEGELRNVRIGQACDVVVEATQGEPYKGTVREIAQQANRAQGTVLVKIDIVYEQERPLKPGMAVQVRFKAPELPPAPGEAEGAAAPAEGAGSATGEVSKAPPAK